MKAHISAKSRISKPIYDAAVNAALAQAEAQADDVAARTLNEIWVAMDGCGLSRRTIDRVRTYYAEAVLPKWEDYRSDGVGDAAMEQYCADHGLPWEACTRGRT